MVDEYQDTNRSQYELMRLLTERPQECLRGGRRGPVDLRLARRRHPQHPGFRARFSRAPSSSAWSRTTAPRRTFWKPPAPWWRTTPSASANGCGPKPATGEKITLYEAPDSENEALWIADTVENRLARNPRERVAVLYRTNSQSRQIEEALRRYGRKYMVVGGFSFYQRAEVKDILAYLKVLVSPQDSISLLRIINTPARGIGRTTIEQMEQYALAHQLSLWSALERMLEEHAFPGPRRGRAVRLPSNDSGTVRGRGNPPHRRYSC